MSRRKPQPIRESERRISGVSLLLLGLLLGLGGGLTYAWVIDPIVYVDAGPARLSDAHREEYIYLVSQSYAVDGDWPRAERRLAALDDPALVETVAALLETAVRQQRPPQQIRRLAVVAQRLGIESRAVALFAPTPPGPATPTPSPTPLVPPTATPEPTATATPRPSPTPPPTPPPTAVPSPTSRPVYRLLDQSRVCDPNGPAPRLEVLTWDALLEPLPGVEVIVTWSEGSDRFYTGFQPERGADYGDFTMTPGVSYSVRLAEGSPEISGLRVEECSSGFAGGWQLTFQNLRLLPTATPEE